MEHRSVTGQGVNAGRSDDLHNGIVILLADQKALHPNHGTAHKRVLVETFYCKDHISTCAGNGKGDLIAQLHAEHGNQRGRDIDLTGHDLRDIGLIGRAIIRKKAVAGFVGVQGDELAFAVGFLFPDSIVGKNDFLSFNSGHIRHGSYLTHETVQIRNI